MTNIFNAGRGTTGRTARWACVASDEIQICLLGQNPLVSV